MTDRSESGSGKPRLLIAGNGSATWAGIKIALERAGIEVCGQVTRAQDLVVEVARLRPDVCLIDVALEGGGIRGAAELGSRAPGTALIMLTAKSVEEEDFLAAMNVGVVGYLPMTISPERLPAAVLGVLDGELAIPRALMPMLVDHLRGRNARRHLMLSHRPAVDFTNREWDVVELMRDELSTREIAGRLMISEVTVRRHIGAVLKKMQVRSRLEAMQLLQSA
jgi:DNA-binding NarL/FixJ family response regulator